MAEHKIRQSAKKNTVYKDKVKKKKREDEEKIVSKKQKSQARRAAAEKSGRAELKKTGNQHADERRAGAIRARENPVNKARGGFQNYVINDKAQGIATAPSKIVSGTLKNAQNTAGTNRHRTNTKSQTQRTDRMTAAQKERQNKAAQEEKQRLQKINKQTKENKRNGYAYGDNVIKSADKLTKKINKSFDKNKEEALNMGASVFSDKKMDIPFYTKYAQGKAKAEAKKALNEGGVTQKKGKENVDNWISETEKNWESQGYEVKDDVVVTDDGKTWGQIKQEAYDQEAARIRFERSKYIHQSADNAGKMSAQDLYKGGVEMASEFIDYGVPYMATAKGSIKVAEKLLSKAAKAGKSGAKTVPKIEKAVDKLVADGTLTPQAAAKFNRQIALKSGAKSFSKELVANALQDATIGTTIDLAKGVGQGLQGEDLEKYMKDNAIANLALGVPMSGIAGRMGAKEAKAAMSMDYAKAINDVTNLTKPEGIELDNLLKKQNAGAATEKDLARIDELKDKALGGGTAVVNSKGKLEVNKADTVADDMTAMELKDYINLRAKQASGTLKPNEMGRYLDLQGKAQNAYRKAEVNAEKTINLKNKKITSMTQADAEAAVRFYERTGDKAKLKQAQDVLERAQKATVKKNQSIEDSLNKMEDITKGKYKWVDGGEMEALSGNRYDGGFYDPATGEIIVNRESPQAYQTVIGHETMHMLKEANREGYDKLANMLSDYVRELGDYDELLAEVKRAYPEFTEKAARGDFDAQASLDEELVSEMLGRYVFGEDDTFIRKLANEEPTTLQKIINYIKKLFSNDNEELAEQFAKLEDVALEEIRKAHPELKARDEARKKWSRAVIGTGESVSVGERKVPAKILDQCYLDAVKSGDLDLAQRIVDQQLRSLGYGIPAFHGTHRYGFTTVDLNKLDDGASIFAARTSAVANTYTRSTKTAKENVKEIGNPHEPLRNKISDSTKDKIEHLNGISNEYLGKDFEINKYLDDLTGIEAAIDGKLGYPKDFEIDEHMEWDNPVTGKHNDSTPIELYGADGELVGDFIKDYSLYNKIYSYIKQEYKWDRGNGVYERKSDEFDWLDLDERDELLDMAREIDNSVLRSLTEYFGMANKGKPGIYQVRLKMDNPLVVDCGGSWWHDIPADAFKYSPSDRMAVENFHLFEQEYKEYVEDIIEAHISDADNLALNDMLDTGKYADYFEYKDDLQMLLEDMGKILDEDDFVASGMSKIFKTNDEYDDAYDTFIKIGKIADDDNTYNTRYVSKYARDNGYDGVIFKDIVDTGNGRYIEDDVYIVFRNEQMKSADAITYDDNGEIILPSQRGLGDKSAKEKAAETEKKAEQNNVELNERGYIMSKDTGEILYDKEDGWKDADFDWEKTHGITEKEFNDWYKLNGRRNKKDFRFSKFGIEGATGEQKELGIKAEKMFKSGEDPYKIWKYTGWVVDTDGKAKIRFSDDEMRLNYSVNTIKKGLAGKKKEASVKSAEKKIDDLDRAMASASNDEEVARLLLERVEAYNALDRAEYGMREFSLGQLITHEELFNHYPQLKDKVTVQFAPRLYINETYGKNTGGVTIPYDDGSYLLILDRNVDEDRLNDYLVHEVQHVIQGVEGFSRGSAPEEWREIAQNLKEKIGKAKGKEKARLQAQYDALAGEYKNADPLTKDVMIKEGTVPYYNTKGEWEARTAEEERDTPKEYVGALDETEAFEHSHNRTGTTVEHAFTNPNEIRVEDYAEHASRKMSKLKKDKAKTAREKQNATKKEIEELDKKFNGKLSDKRRKELEERRRTLEEQLEEERRELNKLNRPLYEERLKEAKEKLRKLEAQRRKATGDEITEIDKKISATKGVITRNENLIKNEPKKYVSDTPVGKLSDDALRKEYNSIQKDIREKETNSILEREARTNRVDALRKEAEKRGLDIRGNLERADEIIKEKSFGWQEAKRLKNEITEIDNQIAELKKGKMTESKYNKKKALDNEREQKNTRLSQVIENSKSVIPEGKSAIDAFDEIVGGNTLKEKGSGKKINKMSARKLIEENGSAGGALKDVGQMIRRKTESSLIEYESAAKRLMKDGQKELGQALLDQTNNVIVYKNKAAAAVESARASADGTKLGKSLNDVFKVKDKNGKVVDLLLEENTKMRQDLSNYLFAKHSFAREEQGKKVFGIIDENGKPKWTNASTQEFMDAIVDKYGKETVDSFEREIRDFINYLNEYRLDTGLISKELLDKLNDIYPHYIPTNRSVVNKPPKEYELPKNVAEVENGIKRAVGGDAPLEDLYTQLVKMTMATIRSGEQNKLLAMYAKAHNIESTRLPKDATADDVLDSSVEAFDSDHKGNWKVRFYDHGEAVTIPVNKHAAKGLREFNGQDYATLMEVSAKSGQLLHLREYKGLITDWNVVFGVRNGMRDAQQALVNSKDSRWYIKSLPRAMAAITNENNAFRILYDANGGRYSTLQQINRLDEIGALNKGKSTVAKGLEKIENFNGIIEMKPRMQEFIGTIQKEADNILGKDGVDKLMKDIEAEAKTKPEGERTAWIEEEYAKRIVDIIKKEKPDIIATAIRNAADITVNFSRSGVFTKALNAGFVPYLNPSIQGLSKMMRMFTETKSNGLLALGGFMGRLTLLTAAPAVINEIMCQGNEAYQSLNTRDKDNNFFIPMSLFGGEKDKFIKIPKPRENSVLAEPFEYGYRWLFQNAEYGNKDDFKQMFESALDNVGVVNVWEDNIFSPVFDTMQNETWYGGKILSDQELKNIKNGEAWKNYDETSTAVAKKIGKMMNWSPKKVDNIMDSYMGLIYDFGISQTSQKNINDVYSSPKNFLKNNPIVQQFTKDAVFSNKYATKFWDKVDELNKGHKGDKDTIEKREYMAKYGYDTFTYDTAISNIDNDKNIPKEDKVEMKRELRKYKNQLLHRALNGEEVKYDPMQRIINLYKAHGVENATDVCLSQYAEGDHAEAYKHLKQSKEYRDATDAEKKEWQQKFLKTYKGVKRIARFTGDSDNFVNYSTVEYVCVKNGYTKGHIANMYAWKSKEYAVEKGLKDMQKYIDAGYTEKNFKVTMRAMNRGADALGDPDKQYASQLDDYDKAMICAKNGYRDGAYLIASPYIGKARMNAGRCLVEGHSGEDYKWTDKRINKFCKKYEITADKNHKWDLEQVADAVRKEYGDKTPEEQAAVYTVITGDVENNPFGEIGDYSHDNDSGLLEDEEKKGKGGRGRRGRRGGRGGGGSGKGKVPSTSSGAIKGKVTDPFAGSNGSKASNLNDAYRKKVKKLREKTYK